MPDTAVILLAEDDENQVLLVQRAFKKTRGLHPLHVVRDGAEAIAYLKGEGRFRNRVEFPFPALLLLDLKMPRKNGFEVMEWIRNAPEMRMLRVVVLTNSDDMNDVRRAYELGAHSFLVKPADFDQFLNLVQALHGYWFCADRASQVSRPSEANPNE
jgi:CheY-like chemotaxis protein